MTPAYAFLYLEFSALDFDGLMLNWTPFLFMIGELWAKLVGSSLVGVLQVGSLNRNMLSEGAVAVSLPARRLVSSSKISVNGSSSCNKGKNVMIMMQVKKYFDFVKKS